MSRAELIAIFCAFVDTRSARAHCELGMLTDGEVQIDLCEVADALRQDSEQKEEKT